MSETISESPDAMAPGYSIRVIARLTGVAADTLRMWERRYGFPHPERSGTGIRAYSEDDLERLQLIVRALAVGHRPGRVVPLDGEALRELLARTEEIAPPAPNVGPEGTSIQAVIDALLRGGPDAVDRLVRQAVATLGARSFLLDFALPLSRQVGELWHEGAIEIRHEHMVTRALSTQVDVLTSTYEDTRGSPTVLLAALPDEAHGLALAMTGLYLTLAGARVHSLGGATPPGQIAKAAADCRAQAVGLSLVIGAEPEQRRREVRTLQAGLPKGTELWLGGRAAGELALPKTSAVTFSTWPELDPHLARLRRG